MTWVKVLTVAAVLPCVAAVLMAVWPQGTVTDEKASRECAPAVFTFVPSRPMPTADPEYAVSEQCHRRARDMGRMVFLTGAAGLVLSAGVLVLWLSRSRRQQVGR